jgi:uncharacterized membrane protein
VSPKTAGWIYGALVLFAVASAAYLFATGNSLTAIKVLLGVFLVPGIVACGVAAVLFTRRPNWYRRVTDVAAVASLSGLVLILAPVMAYMPWAPDRFPLDQMPFGLPVLVWIGGPLLAVGMLLGTGALAVEDWREGDRGRALAWLVMLALIGFLVARVVISRVAGA